MSKKIVIQSHKGVYIASFMRGGMDQLNDNLVANAIYIIDIHGKERKYQWNFLLIR